tara:strand:- start:188 stop:520 length:333 start_codon:yes stop_codon:yes gene_type:complete
MNVSELTDVELNRAMIWLYGPTWILTHGKYRDQGQDVIEMALSYLTDWNLTMPLAVENGISIINTKGVVHAGNNLKAQKGFSVTMDNGAQNTNPLRAICEVLVMIKMESK